MWTGLPASKTLGIGRRILKVILPNFQIFFWDILRWRSLIAIVVSKRVQTISNIAIWTSYSDLFHLGTHLSKWRNMVSGMAISSSRGWGVKMNLHIT
jgi:hypothetical protein